MLHLALRMTAHRITALLAVACAVLGGAVLITATGVLAESGLRSQLPPGRLGGADVVVAADQEYHREADLPIPLPERATVPARLTDRLAALPGVTAAVGDIGFPAALVDARGRIVPSADGDPASAGHGWSSTKLLADPRIEGRAPSGPGEVAVDAATGLNVGDRVRVVANGRPAAPYRVSALVGTTDADADAGAGAGTGADAGTDAGSDPDMDPGSGADPGADTSSAPGTAPGTSAGAAPGTSAGAGVFFADETAVRLSGRARQAGHDSRANHEGGTSPAAGPRAGTVDLIGLTTEPGAEEQVASAVRGQVAGTGLKVLTGADRGETVSPGVGSARSLLVLLSGSLAGIVLLITGFVTTGALGVSIAGQRRDLALMRAVGATPKQIRHLAAAQSTVVAAVALVPGVAVGYLLAGQFRGMLVDRGVLPSQLPLTISPLPALATVLLMAAAVRISARCAAWRTSRMPATEAVAESRSEPRKPSRARTRAGLLLIVAACVMSAAPLLQRTLIGASATSIAGILAAIGLALAGPALVKGVGEAAVRRLRPGVSAPTWLALANVRAYAQRVTGVVSPLAMAVVFVLTYTLAQTTVMAATSHDTDAGTLARHRLSAPGLGGLPTGTLSDVRDLPGVRAAAPVSTTTVAWPQKQFGDTATESASAMILTPAAADVLDLGVREGSLTRLTGATVAVSSEIARWRGSGTGQRVRLILGDGAQVDARVVAVYDRGLGFGPLVLSRDLASGHTTAGLDQSVLVRTDGTAAAERALSTLAASRPGLALSATAPAPGSDAESGGTGGSGTPPEVWINLAVIVVLLAYLLLSIANKLVAATAQRRTEIAALRLVGTTPRQIRAMMRREAAVIATAALTTGLLLSAVPLALLGQGFLDRPWPSGPTWLLPATALTVVAMSFLTIELPTRQALRRAPAEAVRTGA
ncbi:FtsX-like permease family protein [Streptomyces sp. GMY02]|uniref:FtsX-like permease family protein n=1 Tax=Streptomyces sp. GMY02 TaxID=1333528 RepID=UPI001C2CB73E|nr:FtsX-like permease family protein [Streptomyces sp. GMY02]QXE35647.1 FtsX-like permease family protein [Streptomyces sp. GMY02]